MKPSKRHALSKKESKEVIESLVAIFGREVRTGNIEVAVFDEFEVYLIDKTPVLVKTSGRIVPVLTFLLTHREPTRLPAVYVDRGAARAVARGADLMAPGVRSVEGDFEPGALVIVVDEETKAPVMVGEALVSSSELRQAVESKARGRVVASLHHVGDDIWRACTTLG